MKLLSIVIPTRNRPTELESLLDVIRSVASEEIEFVISDNSDQPLKGIPQSGQIRIVRPPRVLNMSENWNYGLRNTTGQYVTFIGDDDLVLPHELDALLNILRTGRFDVVTTQTAGFVWPSLETSSHFFAEIHRRLDQNYATRVKRMRFSKLPIPYNNAVFDKSLIGLFERSSNSKMFFQSRIPDVEAGVKLAFLGKNFYHHDRIVFVSGTSPTSNGLLHRTLPNSPRSLEFSNSQLNPVIVDGVDLGGFVVPFGYFTFYEAASRALSDLGLNATTPKSIICFRSASGSFDPKRQIEINRALWPKLMVFSYIGAAVAFLRKTELGLKGISLIRYSGLAIRLLLGQSRLVSINSSELRSSRHLGSLLEKLERTIYSQRITRIVKIKTRD